MRNLVYAVFRNKRGDRTVRVYHGTPVAAGSEVLPGVIAEYILPFRVSGKTYLQRKRDFERVVHEYVDIDGVYGTLSWGELANVGDWLAQNARRYGMQKELRENAII